MKITSTKCKDGKRHSWKYMYRNPEFGNVRDFKWCKKCGSNTEFVNDVRCWTNYKEGTDYLIEIPSLR